MDTVELDVQGRVAWIWLNRPPVRNAFNAAMISELSTTCLALATRRDVRAVVLAGRGKAFCAGADLEWMRASLDLTHEENLDDALRMSRMFAAIDGLPMPVVCRVHGAALGGGMGLMAVCDFVVAADDAVFGFTETRLGIIPAVISRFVVPKIGINWARALFPTGERFGADLAQRIGLVHQAVPRDELDGAVQAKLAEILGAGPEAARHAKALVSGLQSRPPAEWERYTAEQIAERRTSREGQQGIRAFLDKLPPDWA